MLTIVLVVLAGFGALSFLWVAFGGLLPSPRGMMLVYMCRNLTEAEMMSHRHRWMSGTGVLRCPMIVLDRGLSDADREVLQRKGIETMALDVFEDLLRQELGPDGGA